MKAAAGFIFFIIVLSGSLDINAENMNMEETGNDKIVKETSRIFCEILSIAKEKN